MSPPVTDRTAAPTPASAPRGAPTEWSPGDSAELYRIREWGKGYFAVSDEGTVEVWPDKDPTRSIDLHQLVQGLCERELTPPVLIRFSDILAHRMRELREAFDEAIAEAGYGGRYACVYPIKVNQQRHICEEVRNIGAELGFGLEAGSKPELLAVLALTEGHNDMPIVCNGFKDDDFIETVILATKLGRNIIPVVERFHELELLDKYAGRYGVRPRIGIRAKLSARGVGRWEHSAGLKGKFGLSVSEILRAVEYLRDRDMLDCLEMLHCHIGSQVFDIRHVKNAVTELAHIYSELVRLGARMGKLDIGGGLGVDYDGSHSATESSINYTPREYAADVVYRIQSVCEDAAVAHPDILTESGRALVAYSSVLVCDVLGKRAQEGPPDLERIRRTMAEADEVPQPLLDLLDAYERAGNDDATSVYHDAVHAREEAVSLFSLGYMTLPLRAATEEVFWGIGRALLDRTDAELPDELEELAELLSDMYFCNMSVFQSMPDAWAIDQLFPIMPIHRLGERPTRQGVLADLTCDSDGKIDKFVDPLEEKGTVELHPLIPHDSGNGGEPNYEPYYLGMFLVGAYQETLGDLHNLLGDTHAVHVHLHDDGSIVIDEVVEGDSVNEVLRYVQFDPALLRRAMRRDVELAIRESRLTVQEGQKLLRVYEEGLTGYTYLESQE